MDFLHAVMLVSLIQLNAPRENSISAFIYFLVAPQSILLVPSAKTSVKLVIYFIYVTVIFEKCLIARYVNPLVPFISFQLEHWNTTQFHMCHLAHSAQSHFLILFHIHNKKIKIQNPPHVMCYGIQIIHTFLRNIFVAFIRKHLQ